MARKVLVVAPPRLARKLAETIGNGFEVVTCTDPERAIALAASGTYLAIVKLAGFAKLATDTPVVRVAETGASLLLEELTAIHERARLDERVRAADHGYLATLPYDEYISLVRARATRDYLLALLRRHGGNVAEAARGAGVLRETLHRLIRRHDIDANWFRDDRD
jgi:ActR/RegA family two-component response regulator